MLKINFVSRIWFIISSLFLKSRLFLHSVRYFPVLKSFFFTLIRHAFFSFRPIFSLSTKKFWSWKLFYYIQKSACFLYASLKLFLFSLWCGDEIIARSFALLLGFACITPLSRWMTVLDWMEEEEGKCKDFLPLIFICVCTSLDFSSHSSSWHLHRIFALRKTKLLSQGRKIYVHPSLWESFSISIHWMTHTHI